MLAVRTILHPTDFSETSSYAFALACALARDYHARLLVLHVMEGPHLYADDFVALPQDYREELLNKLHALQAPDASIEIEHRLVQGDPADGILKLALEEGCDVLVVGTHGRTGLGRLLMGSIAEEVLRQAPCPVLMVKSAADLMRKAAEPIQSTRTAPEPVHQAIDEMC